MTVQDIYDLLDQYAPFSTQMDWDNSGLLIGDPEQDVSTALLALDCSGAVIDEAVRLGAQLIITHHPVIWEPLKAVLSDSIVYKLIQNNIAVISAHTNLDVAPAGVNEYLARILELEDVEPYEPLDVEADDKDEVYAIGRIGNLPQEISSKELAQRVKELLGCVGIRFTVGDRPIHRVAVVGGSGGSMLGDILKLGVDAFITADIKLDVFNSAREAGITLIDAGHFETENIIIPPLCDYLNKEAPMVNFQSAVSGICPAQTI